MPDNSYHYIAHYIMDHWSKYHILWPMMKKSAVEIAMRLVTRVLPYLAWASKDTSVRQQKRVCE